MKICLTYSVKNKKIIAFLIFVISAAPGFLLSAQSLDNVQFPPSTEWKKIDTRHFTLIFPAELEYKASEIASAFEAYYPADEYSLDTNTMRWPVIINNSLVYPNAYVLGAPRHSQLYTTPSQDGFQGTADWLEFLWSHELRHIVQSDKMLRGFTAFAYWLFGEYGSSAMPNLAIPRWIWEGDAVVTETLLSTGGRGRIANFERGMRTDLLNGTEHNYYKASLGYYGSYRDPVPSWYVMGYHLSAYIRSEYGIEAFNRIIEISADFSFVPLILNIAVKRVTGNSIKNIYEDCLEDLKDKWSKQLDSHDITDVETIKASKGTGYTNYYPLGIFEDGATAALKSSAKDIYNLVRIDKEGEEKLLRRIAPMDLNVSFNGTSFCWVEAKSDVRWGNLSWSEIRIYTPESGEYRKVTEKTRYMSASISPDGTRVAAVEISPELKSYIVTVDALNGELLSRFALPEEATAYQTCWTDDGRGIIFIKQYDWMESLRMHIPGDNSDFELTAPSEYPIYSPTVVNGQVYFVSEKSGLENIHRVSITGGGETLIVSRPYGTASPAPGSDRLLFSDYGTEGFSITAISLDKAEKTGKADIISDHVNYFEGLKEQEAYAGINGPGIDLSGEKNYTVEDYNIASGLVNFHSRGLMVTNSGTGIAFSLIANDILNYSSGTLYAGLDPEGFDLVAGGNDAWGGLFPVLLYGAELQTPLLDLGSGFKSDIYGGFWIPLDFSEGIYNHNLQLQEILQLNSDYFLNEHILVTQTQASWSLTRKAAKRDIVPPLGVSADALWYFTILPFYYNLISANTDFFLPGIVSNHGITISLNADWNLPYARADIPPNHTPRGYSADDLTAPLVAGTGLDYTFPLFYPDWAIGGFMYISRFYMNAFIDAAFSWDAQPGGFGIPADNIYSTTGLELYMDFHMFATAVPLNSGFRLYYDIMRGGIGFNILLLGVNLL